MAEQVGGIDHILDRPMDDYQVIGIFDDFNFQDLKHKVAPLTLSVNPAIFSVEYLFVRVQTDHLSMSIQAVEEEWKKINPQARIQASFLDENTEKLYRSEQRIGHIVISAAVIAIAISCMGLFALALLAINRRIKEVGVRKVLGSSVSNIVLLISKDFVRLVLLSFLVAAPISWWMMHGWLENFAYHIKLQWWMWISAGGTAVLIAFLTVSSQALKAARANPVESLRDE